MNVTVYCTVKYMNSKKILVSPVLYGCLFPFWAFFPDIHEFASALSFRPLPQAIFRGNPLSVSCFRHWSGVRFGEPFDAAGRFFPLSGLGGQPGQIHELECAYLPCAPANQVFFQAICRVWVEFS